MKKRIIGLMMVAAMAATTLGAVSVQAEEQYKVLVGASNMSGSFYSWLANSCAEECEKLGMKADIFDFESDSANVATLFEQAIVGEYNGVIIDIPDQDLPMEALLEEAKANDVYVIFVNNATEADGISVKVGLDNYTLGNNIGAAAAEMIPENGKGLIMKATPGNTGSEDRYNGFVDALAEAGRDDIEVIAVQNSEDWSKEGAMSVMEDWTQLYDDFGFVYAPCDDMVVGCIEVCAAAGYDTQAIQFFGIDGLANGCNAVKEGTMTATILQNATDEAVACAEALLGMIDGTDTSSRLIALDGTLITQENVDDILAMHEANGMLK